MITWLQYYLVLPMPALLLSAMAAMPTGMLSGRPIGGGPVREYLLNHCALPVVRWFSVDDAVRLVGWFATASGFQEWLMAFVVAININALLLPPLYGLGVVVIGLSSWATKVNIDQKRQAVR